MKILAFKNKVATCSLRASTVDFGLWAEFTF